MQGLWQIGLDRDDELPDDVQERWIQLFKEMQELDKIGFKRCLVPSESSELPVLCVFSDASQEAFGACAYIRQRRNEDTYSVNFVAAKSRVAPLKQPGTTSSRSRLPPCENDSRRMYHSIC